METFLIILGLLVIALLVLGFIHYLAQRARFRKHAAIQETRQPLSDLKFCERISLKPDDVLFVAAIRKALAKRGSYRPEQVYPEDELWETFDFQLGDFIDEFAMGFIECRYGDMPHEKLKQVSDLVKWLVAHRHAGRTKG